MNSALAELAPETPTPFLLGFELHSKVEVSYTDEVIKDQVIAGICDLEIQKDVLSHEDDKNFSLEALLAFIEGKEAGQT